MNQRLSIESVGMIKGGHVDLAIDSEGGVSYNAEVKLRIGIINKTQKFNGFKNLPIEALLSENFKSPGVRQFDEARIEVIHWENDRATTAVDIPGGIRADVVAVTTEDIIRIEFAAIQFRYLGQNLTLKLRG